MKKNYNLRESKILELLELAYQKGVEGYADLKEPIIEEIITNLEQAWEQEQESIAKEWQQEAQQWESKFYTAPIVTTMPIATSQPNANENVYIDYNQTIAASYAVYSGRYTASNNSNYSGVYIASNNSNYSG